MSFLWMIYAPAAKTSRWRPLPAYAFRSIFMATSVTAWLSGASPVILQLLSHAHHRSAVRPIFASYFEEFSYKNGYSDEKRTKNSHKTAQEQTASRRSFTSYKVSVKLIIVGIVKVLLRRCLVFSPSSDAKSEQLPYAIRGNEILS